MGITGPGESQQFTVNSKQSFLKKCLLYSLTAIVWLYSATILYLFVSALFQHNDPLIGVVKIALNVTNYDINQFVFTLVCLFSLCFAGLHLWRYYNKKRFGSLNRRTYPPLTTDDDMLAMQLVSPEDYRKLQTQRVSVFETNPVRDLTDQTEESECSKK